MALSASAVGALGRTLGTVVAGLLVLQVLLWLGFAERLDDTIGHGSADLVARGLDDDPLVLDWFGNLVVDATALRGDGD